MPRQFRRPTLKRHNPTTIRKNTGDDYHGCLRVEVRRSADLYRQIEGWAAAAMDGRGRYLTTWPSSEPEQPCSRARIRTSVDGDQNQLVMPLDHPGRCRNWAQIHSAYRRPHLVLGEHCEHICPCGMAKPAAERVTGSGSAGMIV